MKLETSVFPRENATYLQGVAAYVTGTPAGDLVVGDTMVWNHWGKSTVVEITRETKAFVWVVEHSEEGNHFTRKLKKTRIVARPIDEIQ